MNPADVSQLLERAAAAVTPTETDPVRRLVQLGRRRARRSRLARSAGAAAVTVAVVTVGLVLPLGPDGKTSTQHAALTPGTTVQSGALSVSIPEGWRMREVAVFDPCTAEPRTVYLAPTWAIDSPSARARKPDQTPVTCSSDAQPWLAVVEQGVARSVRPSQLILRDDSLLDVHRLDQQRLPSVHSYRVFDEGLKAPTAFIAGDESSRAQLLALVSWPARPPTPGSDDLVLPDRLASVLGDGLPDGHVVVADDAGTLTRMLAILKALREPVPAGQECPLGASNSVALALASPAGTGATVVLGDATCPQAFSTWGGRVKVPAGLGKALLDSVVRSDRAAADRAAAGRAPTGRVPTP